MAREMMYGEAIATAIAEEMERDSSVVFYGQNLAMTERDPLLRRFGKKRVRIAPISETAEMGVAVGAAITGLRPIVELWMSEFMLVAFDELINEAPRLRYMSGGRVKVPLVFKAGYGFAAGWAGQHSNCVYHAMMGIPGLKIALPSTAADAKGLMAAAVRDDNPVVYLHHYMLTLDKGPVPEGEHVVPFGVADVKRAGSDVTLVATGWMVKKSLAAAELLAKEGISAEVVDPRTLTPLDVETILKSVEKTGRLVLVDQATRHASAAAIIAAEIAEHRGNALKAPVKMVTALDTSIPFSEPLENYVLPNEEKIVAAVKFVLAKQLAAV
ncbi:MAG: alpha-ketoacid dehydrogenase subunit beta [Acidobacteria bacterium Pan2503]|uniref:Alpha-ketoacid dehydrogenase subunit beta n=1 Tax=Candidatus Acidiferrum panamense TaxID=2741543 RepID=A0A7V8NX08_9BACT|nr:alpha-ketoacid dehydrogenase subunit beta [Candidatus Acidoferrum panamensis]